MNDEVEESNLKSRLLMRIVIAVALILAAVVILTLVQHFNSTEEAPQKSAPPVAPKPQPKPALAPPLPVTPASSPVPQPASAPQPAQPAPVSTPQAVSPPIAPAVTEAPPVVETPPPPSVSNVAPAAKASARRHERRQPEKKSKKTGKKAPVEGAYALQFGVFSSESNGGKMVEMLKQKGFRPMIDVRVLAGPYPDKESAEKDRKRLDGNPVPLAKGYALQVGDFQSMKHAHALSEKLRGQKVPVLVQTRVRAGRYASRKAALDAAKKAGIAAIAVRL